MEDMMNKRRRPFRVDRRCCGVVRSKAAGNEPLSSARDRDKWLDKRWWSRHRASTRCTEPM